MFKSLKSFLFGTSSQKNGAGKNGADAADGGAYKKTSQAARSRLQVVLVQDRTGLNNDEMSKFKTEMLGVVRKYFVIDEKAFDIDYKRESEGTTLVINSPVAVRRSPVVNAQKAAANATN